MTDILLQIGILDEVKQYGGYVGYLCIVAVIVLWGKLTSKDKELQELNAQVQKDGKESIRVNTAMSNFIERLVTESSRSEERLADIVRSDGEATRELLLLHKSHVLETLQKTTNAQNIPSA